MAAAEDEGPKYEDGSFAAAAVVSSSSPTCLSSSSPVSSSSSFEFSFNAFPWSFPASSRSSTSDRSDSHSPFSITPLSLQISNSIAASFVSSSSSSTTSSSSSSSSLSYSSSSVLPLLSPICCQESPPPFSSVSAPSFSPSPGTCAGGATFFEFLVQPEGGGRQDVTLQEGFASSTPCSGGVARRPAVEEGTAASRISLDTTTDSGAVLSSSSLFSFWPLSASLSIPSNSDSLLALPPESGSSASVTSSSSIRPPSSCTHPSANLLSPAPFAPSVSTNSTSLPSHEMMDPSCASPSVVPTTCGTTEVLTSVHMSAESMEEVAASTASVPSSLNSSPPLRAASSKLPSELSPSFKVGSDSVPVSSSSSVPSQAVVSPLDVIGSCLSLTGNPPAFNDGETHFSTPCSFPSQEFSSFPGTCPGTSTPPSAVPVESSAQKSLFAPMMPSTPTSILHDCKSAASPTAAAEEKNDVGVYAVGEVKEPTCAPATLSELTPGLIDDTRQQTAEGLGNPGACISPAPVLIRRRGRPKGSRVIPAKRGRSSEGDVVTEKSSDQSRVQCKAGNLKCPSGSWRNLSSGKMGVVPCDVCCSESTFCVDCTCILCGKTFDLDSHEYTFIRCLTKLSEAGVCGHAAHLQCALDCQMAGVLKRIGIDMEYICRRCDSKIDLREHVVGLLESLRHTEVRDLAERSLRLAFQLMQGTEHGGSGARSLEKFIRSAIDMVERGSGIQEVFDMLQSQGLAATSAVNDGIGRQLSMQKVNCSEAGISVHPFTIQSNVWEYFLSAPRSEIPMDPCGLHGKSTDELICRDQESLGGGGMETQPSAAGLLHLDSFTAKLPLLPAAPFKFNAETSLHEGNSSKGMLSTAIELVPVDEGCLGSLPQAYPLSEAAKLSTSEHSLGGASETAKDSSHLCTGPCSPIQVLAMGFDQDIHQALEKLQEAQKTECVLANIRLSAQRESVVNLYEQFDAARSELASGLASSALETSDALMERLSVIFEELQKERTSFQIMLGVRNGFGRTSKSTLRELFGLSID